MIHYFHLSELEKYLDPSTLTEIVNDSDTVFGHKLNVNNERRATLVLHGSKSPELLSAFAIDDIKTATVIAMSDTHKNKAWVILKTGLEV